MTFIMGQDALRHAMPVQKILLLKKLANRITKPCSDGSIIERTGQAQGSLQAVRPQARGLRPKQQRQYTGKARLDL